MLNKNQIAKLLNSMTEDNGHNLKTIKKAYGSIQYRDNDNQTLLHIFVDDKYDEEKCFLAIRTLLQSGLSPNLEADFKYNFIQTALYTGYSEQFILNIIKESLKYQLNVNHVDGDKDTIMHTAIYSDDYLGDITNIYELLCTNGYDSKKLCGEGKNLIQAMQTMKKYSQAHINDFSKIFNLKTNHFFENKCLSQPVEHSKETNIQEKKEPLKITPVNNPKIVPEIINPNINNIPKEDLLELEKYGRILTNKKYITSPTIGREKELKNLMVVLAQDAKRPLIVGASGVGKTALVEELAFRIINKQVPSFLKDKIILEVNPSEIVAGKTFVGEFEENMLKLMKLCEKYNIIVFVDEIHTIYGIGSAKGKENDMASILKYYIDRSNIKVIGTTTTEEYEIFFSKDALKRRFEKITVKEPTQDILYQIINKVIDDYCIKNNISLEKEELRDSLIKVIIYATEKNNRVYNDIVNNPDLAISIIDKSFGFAKYYDSKLITIDHFVEGFEYCDRIHDLTRSQAINSLKKLNKDISRPLIRTLKKDDNKQ